jgi:prepilin-type N-terminal cleavage/methylation domain-containing protein
MAKIHFAIESVSTLLYKLNYHLNNKGMGKMSIKKSGQRGFTIVELLIVIVVIGILAALVIVTFSGIQQKARDTKRQTDVKALHSMLEAFYAQDGSGYPILADVNVASWRATNMKGLDATALCDPSAADQTDCVLVATPAADSYAYQTWDSDGTTACTGTVGEGDVCDKYTLTATLEGTINGEATYAKTSLN